LSLELSMAVMDWILMGFLSIIAYDLWRISKFRPDRQPKANRAIGWVVLAFAAEAFTGGWSHLIVMGGSVHFLVSIPVILIIVYGIYEVKKAKRNLRRELMEDPYERTQAAVSRFMSESQQ